MSGMAGCMVFGMWYKIPLILITPLLNICQRPKETISYMEAEKLLTAFFPLPFDDLQPARQADTYVIPFSPHIGSHSFSEHMQPELHSEKRACS